MQTADILKSSKLDNNDIGIRIKDRATDQELREKMQTSKSFRNAVMTSKYIIV